MAKFNQGDLNDRPRIPRQQPRKTPPDIEDKVLEIKIKTRLGPKRLSRYLIRYESAEVKRFCNRLKVGIFTLLKEMLLVTDCVMTSNSDRIKLFRKYFYRAPSTKPMAT